MDGLANVHVGRVARPIDGEGADGREPMRARVWPWKVVLAIIGSPERQVPRKSWKTLARPDVVMTPQRFWRVRTGEMTVVQCLPKEDLDNPTTRRGEDIRLVSLFWGHVLDRQLSRPSSTAWP